jgi:hypothetical protein
MRQIQMLTYKHLTNNAVQETELIKYWQNKQKFKKSKSNTRYLHNN